MILKSWEKDIDLSNVFLDHKMPSTKASLLWVVSLFAVGVCVVPETSRLISRWPEKEIYLIRSQGQDSFKEQLTVRYNVTSTGGLKFISQVIFPGLQGSHLTHYSHWHMAAWTGWKHLYAAISRQRPRWSLQMSPTTLCTNTWLQLPLPAGSATWGPQREKCSFQKTNTKFCGDIRNGQEIEIQGQTEAFACRTAPRSSRTYKWLLWFHV